MQMDINKINIFLNRLSFLERPVEDNILAISQEFFKPKNAYRIDESLNEWKKLILERNLSFALQNELATLYLQRNFPVEVKSLQQYLLKIALSGFFEEKRSISFLEIQSKIGSSVLGIVQFFKLYANIFNEFPTDIEIDCIEDNNAFSHFLRLLLKSTIGEYTETKNPDEKEIVITGKSGNISFTVRLFAVSFTDYLQRENYTYDIIVANHVFDPLPIPQSTTPRVRAMQVAKWIVNLAKTHMSPEGMLIITGNESRYFNLLNVFLLSISRDKLNTFYPASPESCPFSFYDEYLGYVELEKLIDSIPTVVRYSKRLLSRSIITHPTQRQLKQAGAIFSRKKDNFFKYLWLKGFQGTGGYAKVVSLSDKNLPEVLPLGLFDPDNDAPLTIDVEHHYRTAMDIDKITLMGDIVFVWNYKETHGKVVRLLPTQKVFNLSHILRLNNRNCENFLEILQKSRYRFDLGIDSSEYKEIEQLPHFTLLEENFEFY
ncbi:MAG: hypothetical protein JXA60_13555 [Candidatus Coatesbacteria bacterium]|nr:hypothetical protein [Candidatus Coatesbacteria bacterium]